LEELGFAVVHAPDVATATALLREAGPAIDVVFSDIVMPGEQNGLDLARAVRREHGTRVPVLLATGYSDVAQVAAAEGFRILRKPYSTQQLRDALDETLRATRLWVVV
jgi:two-component system NtrC family sensor kinase